MTTSRPILFASLLFALGTAPVAAQESGARTWLVFGGGVGFAGGNAETSGGAGLAGHLGAAHQRGRFVLGARAASAWGGTSPVTVPGGSLRDRFDELALLAGYAIHREPTGAQIVLSSGVAAVSGERVGPQPEPIGGTGNVDFDPVVGIPIQLALWSTGPASSFGVTMHANINEEETFGAVTASIFVGLGGGRED